MFESSDSEIHTISTERVELCIFSKYFDLVAEEVLLAATESALSLTVGELSTNVCIVLSDDATIKNLNRLHRGLDEVTDVLSFSFVHQGIYYGEGSGMFDVSEMKDFALPPGVGEHLGDVIVAYPQAEKQALSADRTTMKEVQHLIIHGVLHLLGYDHMQPEEEEDMSNMESIILCKTALCV